MAPWVTMSVINAGRPDISATPGCMTSPGLASHQMHETSHMLQSSAVAKNNLTHQSVPCKRMGRVCSRSNSCNHSTMRAPDARRRRMHHASGLYSAGTPLICKQFRDSKKRPAPHCPAGRPLPLRLQHTALGPAAATHVCLF